MDASAASLGRDISRQRFRLINITAETGGNYGFAHALNDAGQVVGRANVARGSNDNAFIFDLVQGLRFLPTIPNAHNTSAQDINRAGQIVGYATSSNGHQALLWEPDGTMKRLDPGTNWFETIPNSINDAGQVTGTVNAPAVGRVGFVWDAANGFRFFPEVYNIVRINARGTVVSENARYAPDLNSSFRPLTFYGVVNDISDKDLIVGHDFVGGGTRGFALKLGKAGSYLPILPTATAYDNRALAVNSRGQIAGFSNGDGLPFRAVFWERGSIHDLNEIITPESGWSSLSQAKDINAHGAIVGYGSVTNRVCAFLFLPGRRGGE